MGNPAGVRRDFDALERRRLAAMRLVDKGLNQAETARRVKVVRQTVARWVRERRQSGLQALKKAGRAGRKPRLSARDRERLQQLLLRGPEALGYETPLWTCARVAHLIEREFSIGYHEGHVWKVLVSLGWSPQRRRPGGLASATRKRSATGGSSSGRPLKKAEKEGRTIVFLDESGISQRNCATYFAQDAPASTPDFRFLAAGFFVV